MLHKQKMEAKETFDNNINISDRMHPGSSAGNSPHCTMQSENVGFWYEDLCWESSRHSFSSHSFTPRCLLRNKAEMPQNKLTGQEIGVLSPIKSSNFTQQNNTTIQAHAVTGMKQSFSSITCVTCLMGDAVTRRTSAGGACYATSSGRTTEKRITAGQQSCVGGEAHGVINTPHKHET